MSHLFIKDKTTGSHTEAQAEGGRLTTDSLLKGNDGNDGSGTERTIKTDANGILQTSQVSTQNINPANTANSDHASHTSSLAVGLRGRTNITDQTSGKFLLCDSDGHLQVDILSGGGGGGAVFNGVILGNDGNNGSGTNKTIKTDTNGRIEAVMIGTDISGSPNRNATIDSNGRLRVVSHYGATISNQQTSGNQITEITGRTNITDNTTKKHLKVDSNGKLETSTNISNASLNTNATIQNASLSTNATIQNSLRNTLEENVYSSLFDLANATNFINRMNLTNTNANKFRFYEVPDGYNVVNMSCLVEQLGANQTFLTGYTNPVPPTNTINNSLPQPNLTANNSNVDLYHLGEFIWTDTPYDLTLTSYEQNLHRSMTKQNQMVLLRNGLSNHLHGSISLKAPAKYFVMVLHSFSSGGAGTANVVKVNLSFTRE